MDNYFELYEDEDLAYALRKNVASMRRNTNVQKMQNTARVPIVRTAEIPYKQSLQQES